MVDLTPDVRLFDTWTSSQSFRAQMVSEPDPELRLVLGQLFVEAVQFEREQEAKQARGRPWLELYGQRITGWWEAPEFYSERHAVHMVDRDVAWCGRPVPVDSRGFKLWDPPKSGKRSAKWCARCWSSWRRWVDWGSAPPSPPPARRSAISPEAPPPF